MNRFELKNTIAKIIVIVWIACLLVASYHVALQSVIFDVNGFFGLSGGRVLPESIVREIRIVFLMLSVGIIGGVSFMIKDFYQSVKYANIYEVSYSDYRSGSISVTEFQRLVPVDIYVGRFNYTWVYWFFVQPVLSSALGVIAFFIARSGLGVLQGSATVAGEITIQGVYLYAVFTFLAGFSSHKFIAWLDRLADKIFSSTLPEQKEELKSRVQTTATMDRITLQSEVRTTADAVAPFPKSTPMPVQKDVPEPIIETTDQTGLARMPMKSIQ